MAGSIVRHNSNCVAKYISANFQNLAEILYISHVNPCDRDLTPSRFVAFEHRVSPVPRRARTATTPFARHLTR
jgi:hypothetical protein